MPLQLKCINCLVPLGVWDSPMVEYRYESVGNFTGPEQACYGGPVANPPTCNLGVPGLAPR